MEVVFPYPPSCFSCGTENTIVVGSVDGIVQYATYDVSNNSFETQWEFKTKGSVRGVTISHDQSDVFAITSNRGISCFDVGTGRRKRCLVRGHDERPTSICLRPPTLATKSHHFSTGDESGEVLRKAAIRRNVDSKTFNNILGLKADGEPFEHGIFELMLQGSVRGRNNKGFQTPQDVNALKNDNRNNLLSASADGTLAAYDIRKRRLRVKSEVMHSELVSICVTDKYVYVGGRDGYLEVFVHGDYGNILQRIETGFDMGVDDVVELRKGLLMACSGSSDKLRLINVLPAKKLGAAGTHGDDDGVDQLMVSADRSTLISMSTFANSIKFWPLLDLLKEIPLEMRKRKTVVKEGFFDDLVEVKTRRSVDENHIDVQSSSAVSNENCDAGGSEEGDEDDDDYMDDEEESLDDDL